MSTSAYEYLVAVDADVYGETKPLDALQTYTHISNLNHLSDEYAQVRAAWAGLTSTFSAKAYLEPSGFAAGSVGLNQIVAFTVPLSLRQSGDGYYLRVRLAGATSAAHNTYFYMIAGPPSTLVYTASFSAAQDYVYKTAATTSTTAAWLTGASQGTQAFTTRIFIPAGQVGSLSFTTSADLGGDPVSVTVPAVTLTIASLVTGGAATPRLYGVYAAEVIGT